MLMIDMKNKDVKKIKKDLLKVLKNKFLNNEIEFQEFYLIGLGNKINNKFKVEKILRIPFDEIIKSMNNEFCCLNINKIEKRTKNGNHQNSERSI